MIKSWAILIFMSDIRYHSDANPTVK